MPSGNLPVFDMRMAQLCPHVNAILYGGKSVA